MVDRVWHEIDREKFDSRLRKLLKRTDDLSPAFLTIGHMFRQSRKTIFDLRSPGGYQDLSKKYKPRKQKRWGFAYPILKASGSMEKSIINRGNKYNIDIPKKKELTLGSKHPILKYHNADGPRKKIPQRKVIFWSAESRNAQKTRPTNTFGDRAIKTIREFILREEASR